MKITNYHDYAQKLVLLLNNKNFDCYVYYKARSGSAYIRFKDERMGSIRVGDHDGREKYKYKFNVRADIKKSYMHKDAEIWRLYFTIDDITGLVKALSDRREQIKTWTTKKYQYGFPASNAR